jgi:hypothetical protein
MAALCGAAWSKLDAFSQDLQRFLQLSTGCRSARFGAWMSLLATDFKISRNSYHPTTQFCLNVAWFRVDEAGALNAKS